MADASERSQDDACGFQTINKIKNNWSGAVAPASPEAGISWWDSGNSAFKLFDGAAWNEMPQIEGIPLEGSIIFWAGGHFTDGLNGGYTYKLGSANTIAGANSYLNSKGWYVCDGAALNYSGSAIFGGASRYLPNLTDNRFIMGDTTCGTAGGYNTNSHTHTLNVVVRTSTGPSGTNYECGAGGTSAANDNHTHDIDYPQKLSTAASNTENRPLYLSGFYIMKVV